MPLPKKTNFLTTALPADQMPEDEHVKALFYGKTGVGKTSLACQAPNPFLIDIDRGSKSLPTMGLGHIPVARPKTVEEVDGIFWEARNNPDYYKTYIIDTISATQRYHLDELIDKAMDGGKRNETVNTQPDYNESTNVIRRLLLKFRELPCNLIVIAQASITVKEGEGTQIIRPATTPSLSATIDEMMDIVGYLELEAKGFGANLEYKRTLRVMPTRLITAKNRFGLPPVIEDPTWDKLMSLARPGTKATSKATAS